MGLILFATICFGWWLFINAKIHSSEIVFYPKPKPLSWDFQSIDTMKYSRDMAREKLKDPSFDSIIEQQIKNIADTGATHVGIATPYDKEFFPILERWVNAARKNQLKVWFRGNWAGWEGWFEYPKINREEHLAKTEEFILSNQEIFQDGDVFTACPECENGGDGDPRATGDVKGFRNFLINQNKVSQESFGKIGKNVTVNYFSMNGDVAQLIMDKETTKKLDGIVTVDHYVKEPVDLVNDLGRYAKNSGGRIILGEFGAPIEDIHGKMSEQEQALWIKEVLERAEIDENIEGVSYWLNVGGGTEIWSSGGKPRLAVSIIKNFFSSPIIFGRIVDEFGEPLGEVEVIAGDKTSFSREDGYFEIKSGAKSRKNLAFSANGYVQKQLVVEDFDLQQDITLEKEDQGILYKIKLFFHEL